MLFCVIYDKIVKYTWMLLHGQVGVGGGPGGSKLKPYVLKKPPSCLVHVIGTKMQLPPCPPWADLAPSAVWMTRGGFRFALVLRGLGYVCYINNSGFQSLHMHTSMFYDKNCIRQNMVLLRESCM